ncbi:MAG TPA: hypothetical protein VGY57_03475 [Vicinamibacterales bacterium]|jgi:hypothetical protein|nr:hypothetical protein [Vicinamibacterales bacterium]
MIPSIILALALGQSAASIDVSKVSVGPAVAVVELDLGKLKGELRQIGWSANGLEIYVQTADGNPPSEKLHHYIVSVLAGTLQPVDTQPDWAQQYWAFKSDRRAPGFDSIEIDVKQEHTTEKIGTGSGRPGTNGTGDGLASGANGAENVSMAAEGQRLPLVTFLLFGERISEFKNTRPIPGLMFSWGPRGTGSIAFTDLDGHLMLLDREKRTQKVAGVKDATLPAWSADGAHLAWAQKTGRKKFMLIVATVGQ